MVIYTKRGDKGDTSLYDKKSRQNIRISKSSTKINAIGAIDELNSWLGLIGDLENVQRDLFTIGAILAETKLRFSVSKTKKLEKEIDKLEGKLPILKNFILYSGCEQATKLFYARAVCRRAERALVYLHSSSFVVHNSILAYMNRLSDYLFMLARKANFEAGVKEEIWTGKNKK